MNSFGRKMSLVLLLLAIVGGFGIVSANLQFEPEGVRRDQREEYAKKLAQIRHEEKLRNEGKDFPHAKAEPVEKHFNFGMLDPHATASHAFEIRNTGDADLFLKAGETSCKCTVGTVGSGIVPPGHFTTVTLEWNTGYQVDDYQQSAIVHTNDPEKPTITLSVQGQVRAELVLMHSSLELPHVDLGEVASASTFLYSQLWSDFVIESVTCDLPGFQWVAEPIGVDELPSGDLDAKSAWRLKLSALPSQYGKLAGLAKVSITPIDGSETVEREINLAGKVRVPISFSDPDLDVKKGLDLGLMVRGTEHRRSVIVRLRGNTGRELAVLDVMPKQMKAELEETAQPGVYKLTMIAPADASPVLFNRTNSQGYVQVGDPEDKKLMNWMPIMGAIVNSPSNR